MSILSEQQIMNKPIVEILNDPDTRKRIIVETFYIENKVWDRGQRELNIPEGEIIDRIEEGFSKIENDDENDEFINSVIHRHALYYAEIKKNFHLLGGAVNSEEERFISYQRVELIEACQNFKTICDFARLLYPEISITLKDIKKLKPHDVERLNSMLSALDQYFLHNSAGFLGRTKRIRELESRVKEEFSNLFGTDKDRIVYERDENGKKIKKVIVGSEFTKRILGNLNKWENGRKKVQGRPKGSILEDRNITRPPIFL